MAILDEDLGGVSIHASTPEEKRLEDIEVVLIFIFFFLKSAKKEKSKGLLFSLFHWNFRRLKQFEEERSKLTPEERMEYDKEHDMYSSFLRLVSGIRKNYEEEKTTEGLHAPNVVIYIKDDKHSYLHGNPQGVKDSLADWDALARQSKQAQLNNYIIELIDEGRAIIKENKIGGETYKQYARRFGRDYFGALWYRRLIAWLTRDYDHTLLPLKTGTFGNSNANWSNVVGNIRHQLDQDERDAQNINNDYLS